MFPSQIDQLKGKILVSIVPKRHHTNVRVVLEALENLRTELNGMQLLFLYAQKGLQRFAKIRQHLIFQLLEQIVHVGIVHIKRTAVNPGPFAQFPNGNGL